MTGLELFPESLDRILHAAQARGEISAAHADAIERGELASAAHLTPEKRAFLVQSYRKYAAQLVDDVARWQSLLEHARGFAAAVMGPELPSRDLEQERPS